MTNIVFEGPDGSGKSTLIDFLAPEFKRTIIHSPGPPRTFAQFQERVNEALAAQNVIFDRHPVVSERIYGALRGHTLIDPRQEERFYESRPLIIYCAPSIKQHTVKSHDTPEHIALITTSRNTIVSNYNDWAIGHAHLLYRIGDDKQAILDMIKAICPLMTREEFDGDDQ